MVYVSSHADFVWVQTSTPVKMRSPSLLSWTVFACALASWLQGCAETPGPCPLGSRLNTPNVNFNLDWERLDRMAGCNNIWNLLWGKSCASDVPVLLGKKSLNFDTDKKWVQRNLENAEQSCLTWYPGGAWDKGGCSSWFISQRGCSRDELSICNCTDATSESIPRCKQWRCMTKEIEHRTCWEAAWDSAFETECDKSGDHPMWLYMEEFARMLRAEVSATEGTPSWELGTDSFIKLLASARASTRWFFKESPNVLPGNSECIVYEPVLDDATKKPSFFNCNSWRLAISKVLSCKCQDDQCKKWRCTSDDPKHNVEKEERDYKCLSRGDKNKCISWSGEVQGFPTSSVGECRACKHTGSGSADCVFMMGSLPGFEAVCTMYVVPSIHEFQGADGEDGIFTERIGFWALHGLWIGAIAYIAGLGTTGFTFFEGGARKVAGVINFFWVSFWALLVWVIGFVRDVEDVSKMFVVLPRYEWVAPIQPAVGILLSFHFASLLTWFYMISFGSESMFGVAEDGQSEAAAVFPFVVLCICLIYACGLLAGLAMLPCVLLLLCNVIAVLKKEYVDDSSWADDASGLLSRFTKALRAKDASDKKLEERLEGHRQTLASTVDALQPEKTPSEEVNPFIAKFLKKEESKLSLAEFGEQSNKGLVKIQLALKNVVAAKRIGNDLANNESNEIASVAGWSAVVQPFKLEKGDIVAIDPDRHLVKLLCEKTHVGWQASKSAYLGDIGEVTGHDKIGPGIRVKFANPEHKKQGQWWSFPPQAMRVQLETLSQERRDLLGSAPRFETATESSSGVEGMPTVEEADEEAKTKAGNCCQNGCGRPRFKGYHTCCTWCKGPEGPHAQDCCRKARKPPGKRAASHEPAGHRSSGKDSPSSKPRSASLSEMSPQEKASIAKPLVPTARRSG